MRSDIRMLGPVQKPIPTGYSQPRDGASSWRLDKRRVDVWRCPPRALARNQIRACLTTLSHVERERYRRMRSADARLHFIVGRALARSALSRYADVPAGALRFAVDADGRPSVASPRGCRDIHFSISHTSGMVAVAISPVAEVGVDLERIDRRVDISEIAEAVFTPDELERILQQDEARERTRFFELWTLKEAYIKARGRGFAIPPRTFAFAGVEDPIRLDQAPECDAAPERWRFALSRCRTGLRMAIAVGSRSVTRIRQFDWDPVAEAHLVQKA